MRRVKGVLAKTLAALVAATALFSGVSMETKAASYFNAYDKAPYEKTSGDFSLKVDGKSVDVVSYFENSSKPYSYAHLAYEGTATFEIKSLGGNISSYNLSPHSYGMQGNLSGSTLKFSLEQTGSRYIILQAKVNGTDKMLVIAADPKPDYSKYLEVNRVVDVTKAPYKADNTGKNYASDAIQKAINDVSAAGGGTVYIPKGVYKIVYLDAADNVTLYLAEGTFLRGSGITGDYTWNDSGSNGRQGRRDIAVNDAKNFAIVGRGVIDGNSIALVDATSNGNNHADGWDDFRKGIIDGNNAEGFLMDGVTVKDSAGWTFCVEKSKNITIKNVKLLADHQFIHTDGYDFVSCQDVYITDCLGVCGDDVFCPKSSYEGFEMKNYRIENGVAFAHGGAGCKVGMQARATTENIVFRNIDVIQGYRGFTVAHDTGNGNFYDIVFEDIRTEKLNTHTGSSGQFRAAPFVIWTRNSGGNKGSVVDGVTVKNCSFETFNNKYMCVIQGSEGANSWVKNVNITDLTIAGTKVTEDNYTDFVTHGSYASGITYNTSGSSTGGSGSDSGNSGNGNVYEAEAANVAGGAEVVSKKIASGGKIVGNIGGDGKGNGKVIFTVNAPGSGAAELKIYYLLKGDRRFYLTVNNGDASPVECSGDNWDKIQVATVPITLNSGSNTIKLDNGAVDEWAPNLDKIEITMLNQTVYEAEDAKVADGAEVVSKKIASGGAIVGNIGGNGKDNGKVTFTVNAPSSGKAYMDIYYLLKGNRNLYVTVNSNPYFGVACSGNNWDEIVKATVEIELNQGSNTIKFDNGAMDEWAPNLDKIEIRMQ